MGSISNRLNSFTVDDANGNNYDKLFAWPKQRPDQVGASTIVFDVSRWMNDPNNPTGNYRADLVNSNNGESESEELKSLYISWARIDSNGTVTSSSKYKVSGGWKGTSGYVLKLNREITEVDADIAHVNGKSIDQPNKTHLHGDLSLIHI